MEEYLHNDTENYDLPKETINLIKEHFDNLDLINRIRIKFSFQKISGLKYPISKIHRTILTQSVLYPTRLFTSIAVCIHQKNARHVL